ncbi:hypothetical protein AC249_AIPGENE19261 [Exaiptasia diaphana]|nr:hypothetical protein AC249_AIPGENE19261 [Exaiptasia diaphana]
MKYMSQDQTFGDQQTLFAAANLFNVNIQVVSTLGHGANHLFQPTSSNAITIIYLGHFAEHQENQDEYSTCVTRAHSASCNDEIFFDANEIEGQEGRSAENVDLPYLNNDVMELIIKTTMSAFPFMWGSLRAVNTFFKKTVDKIPKPNLKLYIPELSQEKTSINVKDIIHFLKRKEQWGSIAHNGNCNISRLA